LKISDGIGGHINESRGVNWICVRSIVSASSIGGSVGVVSLSHWVVGFVVVKGASLPTTVATHAGLNTVNKLLLGEGEK